MQNFVVHTQFLENYGAHCEDGKFSSGNAYWKMKGGDTYIVQDLDRIQDAVAFVAAQAMENGISAIELPCSWSTEEEWLHSLNEDSEEYQEYQREQAILVSPKRPKDKQQYMEIRG